MFPSWSSGAWRYILQTFCLSPLVIVSHYLTLRKGVPTQEAKPVQAYAGLRPQSEYAYANKTQVNLYKSFHLQKITLSSAQVIFWPKEKVLQGCPGRFDVWWSLWLHNLCRSPTLLQQETDRCGCQTILEKHQTQNPWNWELWRSKSMESLRKSAISGAFPWIANSEISQGPGRYAFPIAVESQDMWIHGTCLSS